MQFDFMYGTAWKEEMTQPLVLEALNAGFRAVDTANQRKHYYEAAVGAALAEYFDSGNGTRDEIFVQTKYTFQAGQDSRLPYDPSAPIGEQVTQSVSRSKEHLGLSVIDSLILHGPTFRRGLHANDWAAWKSMEETVDRGDVIHLGVSNCDAEQLEELISEATIKPRYVQNRCYTSLLWDAEVRSVCAQHGIVYQGFSLLTANIPFLNHPVVTEIADAHQKWPAQIVFRYCLDIGILPITGTTDVLHMKGDLACSTFSLSKEHHEALNAVSEQFAGGLTQL